MSKKLKCGQCSKCCEWGGDINLAVITPTGRLPFGEDGNCKYLVRRKCSIHKNRPDQCRKFDCRALYKEVMGGKNNLFLKILIQGSKRT